jgi:serine/threonine protein kinase
LFHTQWQAPEQFLRSAALTHKADVFSLGNVLYFLLTGNKPFHELNGEKAENEVCKGTHLKIDESILKSRHPFDVSLQMAIDMCRVFDPEERPDAQSVAAFLRKALADYNQTILS